MDKWIGCNPKSHLELDMWQVRGHLTRLLSSPNRLGEMGKGREKGKPNLGGRVRERERGSIFSLDFLTMGPSVFDEARGKISSSRQGLRIETGVGEFRQTPRGRGFLLLGLILV